jgi:N-acetylglucosamine kinase-like BadF-type ATPase
VVICDAALQVQTEYSAGPANPRLIGFDKARGSIQAAIRTSCRLAGLNAGQITALGIGIAGAAADHSHDWLFEILHPILPDAQLALSSDFEIALVGALGQPEGLLILAGTGSAAYVRSAGGRSARVGGWGYVLGDEGSAYSIGLQALKLLTRQADAQGWQFAPGSLSGQILQALNLESAAEVLDWLYGGPQIPVTAIAALAPLVIAQAEAGDADAFVLLKGAAQALADMLETLRFRLDAPHLPVAFAGGLLSEDNILTRELCRQIGLAQRPIAMHSPVIGAALFALLRWKASLAHDRPD